MGATAAPSGGRRTNTLRQRQAVGCRPALKQSPGRRGGRGSPDCGVLSWGGQCEKAAPARSQLCDSLGRARPRGRDGVGGQGGRRRSPGPRGRAAPVGRGDTGHTSNLRDPEEKCGRWPGDVPVCAPQGQRVSRLVGKRAVRGLGAGACAVSTLPSGCKPNTALKNKVY